LTAELNKLIKLKKEKIFNMKNQSTIFQNFNKKITKNLNLRILKKRDINDVYIKALNNESIVGMTQAIHKTWTRKNIEEFIDLNNNSSNMLLIGVFLKEKNIHLGNVRLLNICRVNKRAEISMLFFRKEYWNKGFATEALREVINYSFKEMGLRRICADYFENNFASKKIFEKLCFKVEGIYKEHFYSEGKFVNSIRVALMKEMI
tara:strand:+ start:1446 stop:2060 length:615 start_codon:yes stop_codon:yes gene_type:complete